MADEYLKEKIEYLKIVAEHYRMDVQAVWVRSTAFIAINAGIIALYGSSYLANDADARFYIILLSVATNVFWGLNQYVTSEWIADWRHALCHLDSQIKFPGSDYGMTFYLVEEENNGLIKRKKKNKFKLHKIVRPQHIARAVPWIIMSIWIGLFFNMIGIHMYFCIRGDVFHFMLSHK